MENTKVSRWFIDYVYSFYGKKGLYNDFFADSPLTKKEILVIANSRIKHCKNIFYGEDTMDREIIRDVALFLRGHNAKTLEYPREAKKIALLGKLETKTK